MDFHEHAMWEIVYIPKGNVEIDYLKSKGNSVEKIYGNSEQVVIIPPGIRHKFIFLNETVMNVLEIIEKDNLLIEYLQTSNDFKNDQTVKRILQSLGQITCCNDISDIGPKFSKLINLLRKNYEGLNDEFFNIEYNFAMKDILLSLYKDFPTSPQKKNNLYINKCVSFISEHYSEDIDADTIVTHVGVSASYLAKLFKRTFSMSLMQYVNHIRIEKAIYLLKNTSLSLSDIAVKSGLKNYNTMYRFFKKEFARSPTEIVSAREFNSLEYFNENFHVITFKD